MERRKKKRIPLNESVPITLVVGDRQCLGALCDFTHDVSCSFKIGGPEFDKVTMKDIKELMVIYLHGQQQPVRLLRIEREAKTLTGGWKVVVQFL